MELGPGDVPADFLARLAEGPRRPTFLTSLASTWNLERETGVEPATLGLGISPPLQKAA